jgi:Tol biopolymer transport system component
MQKEPLERFQSARDLAFALDAVGGDSVSSSSPQPSVGAATVLSKRRRWTSVIGGAAAVLAVAAAGLAGRLLAPERGLSLAAATSAAPTASASPFPARFEQITFRPGIVDRARFAPDGKTIVFTEQHEGAPRVYSAVPGNPDARVLSPPSTLLMDLSVRGELALVMIAATGKRVLARAPISGGAPRPIAEDVDSASWAPDGGDLLVIRNVGSRKRIEYPMGHAVFETDAPQVYAAPAPDGSGRIALVRQVVPSHGIGRLELIEPDGKVRPLSKEYASTRAPAWAPDGREIWFVTGDGIEAHTLRAVSLDGRDRTIYESPAQIVVEQIASDGRVLLKTVTTHHRVAGLLPGSTRETDVSWLEWSDRPDLSADGKRLLTSIVGNAAPDGEPLTYLRDSDTLDAVQLSHGIAHALSPDGRFALVAGGPELNDLSLVPTGVGSTVPLSRGSIDLVTRGFFFPDGKKILLVGHERDRPTRAWVVDVPGGAPIPMTEEGVLSACAPSPDGKWIAGFTSEHHAVVIPSTGGPARPIDHLADGELPIAWTEGGRGLFVRRIEKVERLDGYVTTGVPVRIDRFDLARGTMTPWHELVPGESAARVHVDDVAITPDGRFYTYAYGAFASTLYVAKDLR